MSSTSPALWELSVVLPLGVVAGQLRKIEDQLRRVNMKALSLGGEGRGHVAPDLAETRLEEIGESLDALRALLGDIRKDLQPDYASERLRSDRHARTETVSAVAGDGLYADAERQRGASRGQRQDCDD